MAYRIAICDDSVANQQYVSALLDEWAALRGLAVQVEAFPSAERFLFCCEEGQPFDLLLLNVEMGAMDGVALTRQVRRRSDLVQIIFITGYSDYIAEGYEVEALLSKDGGYVELFEIQSRYYPEERSEAL
ncbi:MAG: response regulator [Clostridiales bacterium]|nr:response regulator [Clostridiales bacterium]